MIYCAKSVFSGEQIFGKSVSYNAQKWGNMQKLSPITYKIVAIKGDYTR